MKPIVVRSEGISKRYQIGENEGTFIRYKSLRQVLSQAVNRSFRRLLKDKTVREDEIFWALKDVSFEVGENEAVGIIGRNGSGKSTLLKILSRVTPPTEGRMKIRGQVGSLLEVGTGFHAELTGRENVFLNAAILGMKKREIQRKFDEIVAFSEIEKFIDTPVKRYSSGMYVRLAFSVAAHLDPQILIVDEVLAVGDAAFQQKCLERMRKLKDADKTVFFVSHNMYAVQMLCSKVFLLDKGKLISAGRPDEVIHEYENRVREGLSQGAVGEMRDGAAAGVEITDIQLFDGEGQETGQIPWGKRATVRLSYEATQPIPKPVFTFSVFRSDGLQCCSSSTKLFGLVIKELHGKGFVEAAIPELRLVPGAYRIVAHIYDENLMIALDQRESRPFQVGLNGHYINEGHGVFVQAADWLHQNGH